MSANNDSISFIDRIDQIYEDLFSFQSSNQSKVDTVKMFLLGGVYALLNVKEESVFLACVIALLVSVVTLLIAMFNSNKVIATETSILALITVIAIYYDLNIVALIAITIYVFVGAGSAAVKVKNETNVVFTYVSLACALVGLGTAVPGLFEIAKFSLLFIAIVMIFVAAFSTTAQILITEEISSVIILVSAYANHFDIVVILSIFLLLYNIGKYLGKDYKRNA